MCKPFLLRVRIVVLALVLVFGARAVALSDALDTWTGQPVITHVGGTLRGVAFGNGRYVVIGDAPCTPDYGAIFTSDDALQWTLRRNGCAESLDSALYEPLDITFAQNMFVAVGYLGTIYGSPNGLTWALEAQAPFYNFNGVTFGNGRFVAVGDGQLQGGGTTRTNIYTSDDGVTWTPRRSGTVTDNGYPIYAVAYGNGLFLAIGSGPPGSPGIIYRSTTGTTWTRSTFSGAFYYITHMNFCNGSFLISGGAGTNLFSTDGITWTVQTNDSGVSFAKVLFNHGLYVGIGFSSSLNADLLVTSTNGTNWTPHTFSRTRPDWIAGLGFGDRNAVALTGQSSYPANTSSIFRSDPFIGLEAASLTKGQLRISGLTGAPYRIEYRDSLGTTSVWQGLATVTLPTSPYLWTDPAASSSPARFYRAVLLP